MKQAFRLPDVGEGTYRGRHRLLARQAGDTVTISTRSSWNIETAKAVARCQPLRGHRHRPALAAGRQRRRHPAIHRGRRAWPGRRGDGKPRPPENRHQRTRPRRAPEAKAGRRGHAAAGCCRLRRRAGLRRVRRPRLEAADAPEATYPATPRRAGRPAGRPGRPAHSPPGSSCPRHSPRLQSRGRHQGDESGPTTAPTNALGAQAQPGARRRGESGRTPPAWGGTGGSSPGGKIEAMAKRPVGRLARDLGVSLEASKGGAGRLGHQGGCREGGRRCPHPFCCAEEAPGQQPHAAADLSRGGLGRPGRRGGSRPGCASTRRGDGGQSAVTAP